MKLSDIHRKVRNRWKKFRLQPLRVFCLHHVSAIYVPESMNRGDWMQIDEFKSKVLSLQQDGVEFISLQGAYEHIKHDFVRTKKYAVLAFDDGYASLKEVLPWLDEQKLPCTLFINGKYLDGKSYRKNPKECYLTIDDLDTLYRLYPLITIASHGWDHTDATQMPLDEFKQNIVQNFESLKTYPRHIPFHAYTWGRHTSDTDAYLLSKKIIPVYIDGMKNYNDAKVIHRELL